MLDPKPSDLTMIRVIKARTGYRCKDIRGIVVQNCDLGQVMLFTVTKRVKCMVLYTSGNREDFIGENLLSEGQ
nr:hypothetical protein [Tanacetum cinerariifolium]